MPRDLIYHLDDFRHAMTPEAFRVFAVLDQLQLISADAKHSLAQCCASSLPSTVEPQAVMQLIVIDGIHQLLAYSPDTFRAITRRG